MAIVNLYNCFLSKTYRAYFFTPTTFIVFFIRLVAFVPPLLVVIIDGTFLKQLEREQKIPSINFTYELVCEVETEEKKLLWSTIENTHSNIQLETSWHATVEQEDEESDGRQDRMYLSLILPSFNYSFRQVDLLVFYEIKFKGHARFRLSSMAVLHFSGPPSVEVVEWIGSLQLVQQKPINFLDYSLNREKDATFSEAYDVPKMLKANNLRPVRTRFVPEVVISSENTNASNFNLSATINYPLYFDLLQQKPLLNHVKTFLVEFIALYIPFHLLSSYIIKFLLLNGILVTLHQSFFYKKQS